MLINIFFIIRSDYVRRYNKFSKEVRHIPYMTEPGKLNKFRMIYHFAVGKWKKKKLLLLMP